MSFKLPLIQPLTDNPIIPTIMAAGLVISAAFFLWQYKKEKEKEKQGMGYVKPYIRQNRGIDNDQTF